jgi:transcription elongation GreA/GreB family factor
MSIERKRLVLAGLIAQLEADLAAMTKAARDAHAAATHEEAKPENDKDTRALEASYLAAGQAERVRELEGAIKALGRLEVRALGEGAIISASALITLEDDDGAESTYFLAPHGGGLRVALADGAVQVLTPQSPLGQALLGRTRGDVVELRARGRLRELTVVDVR